MSSLKRVNAELANLNSEDLESVLKTAKWLYDRQGQNTKWMAEKADRMLLNAIVYSLRRNNAYLPPTECLKVWPPRVKGFQKKEWDAAKEEVMMFKHTYLHTIPPRYDQAIYMIITDSVIDWMQYEEDTILIKRFNAFMNNHRRSISGAVNKQFVDDLKKEVSDELRKKVPLSMPRVVRNLTNVEQAINHSFPSYLDSGIIDWIFKTSVRYYDQKQRRDIRTPRRQEHKAEGL